MSGMFLFSLWIGSESEGKASRYSSVVRDDGSWCGGWFLFGPSVSMVNGIRFVIASLCLMVLGMRFWGADCINDDICLVWLYFVLLLVLFFIICFFIVIWTFLLFIFCWKSWILFLSFFFWFYLYFWIAASSSSSDWSSYVDFLFTIFLSMIAFLVHWLIWFKLAINFIWESSLLLESCI